MQSQKILILDFGSQYSQLIARRVRELGVYCELFSWKTSEEKIKAFRPAGIILSGGPETVLQHTTPRAPDIIFELGCPILGICYGMQTMATQLGGKVSDTAHSEYGHAQLTVDFPCDLLAKIADDLSSEGKAQLAVWMSHGDQVVQLPPQFTSIAHTPNTPIAVMADDKRHFYGVQFHPEVTHTHQGQKIFARFVQEICGCAATWTPQSMIKEIITDIRTQVKHDQVILGLSGGVDSLVAAVLLQQAIGKQLICVFVDHGLHRHKEAEYLMDVQAKRLGLHVIHVDARALFLAGLKNIIDPEAKRKIIGKLFIDVFAEQAKNFPAVKWLAQGTIYSDVIESAHAGDHAHTIKSHHNVGGLPEILALPLIEPLRHVFKDEVRRLGLELGLPHDELYRHPFPGPGLAVRIIGEVTAPVLETLKQADAIFMQELHQSQLYGQVAQAFCVYLPVCSVGVVGDARRYAPIIALRAIESQDYMTANAAALPFELLQRVSQRIVNEVPNISRVVYDVTSKPPATIEWE